MKTTGNKPIAMRNFNQHLPEGITAALIDMDGVLYDSMPSHAEAWHSMLAEKGIRSTKEEFFLYEGMTGADIVELIMMREFGRHATPEEKKNFYARKSEFFTRYGERKPMPGASEMTALLHDNGIRTVLVTGSGQASLLNSLDKDYPGIFPSDRRVTAHDVANGKPNPEPYLKGAEKAGVTPAEAIVIENAPLGVRAGKAAGCFTVAVTTGPIPREAFEKEGADIIFPSIEMFCMWLENELNPSLGKRLDATIEKLSPDSVTVITDSNVFKKVFPLLKDSTTIQKAETVVLNPGETHKNIGSVSQIWESLTKAGATRGSLIVNIGGGIVTDIGGFAAATFKRGIRFVNFPTTLLGAVDAASGGKTGVNFCGLKNEIGAFHLPSEVIISSKPIATLPFREIRAGYAEMIKTGLIGDKELYQKLFNLNLTDLNLVELEKLMVRCVNIKNEIVNDDPTEKGLRKVLNFGHTAGHAFESFALRHNRDLNHGEAVAHGMLVELILSLLMEGLPGNVVSSYNSSILREWYPRLNLKCDDIDELIEFMSHDKKNRKRGEVNFTLLKEIGQPVIDCHPDTKQIKEALDIFRDLSE